MIKGNVIHLDPATFYCMRQCQEAIKYCKAQHNPVYNSEIEAERALYDGFMAETLGRAA